MHFDWEFLRKSRNVGLELKMVDTSAIGADLNRAILLEMVMERLAGRKPQIIATAEVAACEIFEQCLQLRVGLVIAFLDHRSQWRRKCGIYFAGNPGRLTIRGVVRSDPDKSCPVHDPVFGKFFVSRKSTAPTGKPNNNSRDAFGRNPLPGRPKFLL